MGCWTETCILSRLPIEEKEYCVIIGVNKDLLTNLFDIDKLRFMFNPYPCPDLQIYAANYNGRGNIKEKMENAS